MAHIITHTGKDNGKLKKKYIGTKYEEAWKTFIRVKKSTMNLKSVLIINRHSNLKPAKKIWPNIEISWSSGPGRGTEDIE